MPSLTTSTDPTTLGSFRRVNVCRCPNAMSKTTSYMRMTGEMVEVQRRPGPIDRRQGHVGSPEILKGERERSCSHGEPEVADFGLQIAHADAPSVEGFETGHGGFKCGSCTGKSAQGERKGENKEGEWASFFEAHGPTRAEKDFRPNFANSGSNSCNPRNLGANLWVRPEPMFSDDADSRAGHVFGPVNNRAAQGLSIEAQGGEAVNEGDVRRIEEQGKKEKTGEEEESSQRARDVEAEGELKGDVIKTTEEEGETKEVRVEMPEQGDKRE